MNNNPGAQNAYLPQKLSAKLQEELWGRLDQGFVHGEMFFRNIFLNFCRCEFPTFQPVASTGCIRVMIMNPIGTYATPSMYFMVGWVYSIHLIKSSSIHLSDERFRNVVYQKSEKTFWGSLRVRPLLNHLLLIDIKRGTFETKLNLEEKSFVHGKSFLKMKLSFLRFDDDRPGVCQARHPT